MEVEEGKLAVKKKTQNKKKRLSKNQRTAKKKAETKPPSDPAQADPRPGESSTEELDGETYKRRKLSGTAPRFETIYVPAVPGGGIKEQIGGEITPTEPCEEVPADIPPWRKEYEQSKQRKKRLVPSVP